MSHGRIAKTKFMIYWKNKVEMGMKKLLSNEHIRPGRKTRIDSGL